MPSNLMNESQSTCLMFDEARGRWKMLEDKRPRSSNNLGLASLAFGSYKNLSKGLCFNCFSICAKRAVAPNGFRGWHGGLPFEAQGPPGWVLCPSEILHGSRSGCGSCRVTWEETSKPGALWADSHPGVWLQGRLSVLSVMS